jgi:hypothetical protein
MDTALLNKIEKLFNLQEGASTVGEAEAAAAAITRLMTKHNLEMAEVRQRLGDKAPKSEYEHEIFDAGGDDGWIRGLATRIAGANFCKTYYIPGTSRIGIVGESGNIETVKRLLFSLRDLIRLEARREYRKRQKDGTLPELWVEGRWKGREWVSGHYAEEGLWRFVGSFTNGAVDGIGYALKAAKKAEQDAYAGGSALVLVKDRELQEATGRLVGNLGVGRRRSSSGSGYKAGHAFGSNLNLGRGEISG